MLATPPDDPAPEPAEADRFYRGWSTFRSQSPLEQVVTGALLIPVVAVLVSVAAVLCVVVLGVYLVALPFIVLRPLLWKDH